MYELVQVSEKCYYINCPAKIGVYVADEDHVYLVDSGNDKDAGRKVRQILDKKGWHLTAILNTHSNADHIGGNNIQVQALSCIIPYLRLFQQFASMHYHALLCTVISKFVAILLQKLFFVT